MSNPLKNIFSLKRKPFSILELAIVFTFIIVIGGILSFFSVFLNDDNLNRKTIDNVSVVTHEQNELNILAVWHSQDGVNNLLGIERVGEYRLEIMEF